MRLSFTAFFLFLFPTFVFSEPIKIISEIESKFSGSLVDTRDLSKCLFKTIKYAKCLPASGLVNEKNIISVRDLYWLFSVSDLDHEEKIILFGNKPDDIKFVAGLLFLSGQKNIYILDKNISSLFETYPLGKGLKRKLFRIRAYKGKLRESFLDFESDSTPLEKKQDVIQFVESIIFERNIKKVGL